MANARHVALTAAMLACACGCGLIRLMVGTEIEVEGGHRTVEQQVLGAFDHIGEEVYLLAGVRAVDPMTGEPSAPPPMTPGEARALAARRRMEFNRDDLVRFQVGGYAGEGNLGLPVPFDERVAELEAADPRSAALLQEVVAQETEDRLVIVARIVDTVPDLKGEEGRLTAQRILAARYRQEAPPGVPVQMPDGAWSTR